MKSVADNVHQLKRDNQSQDELLSSRVRFDRIGLLYAQIHIGIAGQYIVSMIMLYSLWAVIPKTHIINWGLYISAATVIWMTCAIIFRCKREVFDSETWLKLFAMCTLISGCAWGIIGSFLMPNDLLSQSFVIIIIIGMTAAGSAFFSSFVTVYTLYLFPAFIPLDIWMFIQGGYFGFIGLCGLIYMAVMFGSCFYSSRFLVSSLTLRYKNIDLDALNQFLERRVAEKTSDLEKSLAITQSTLESTADGILVVDTQGNIEYSNQKFLQMWGITENYLSLRNTGYYLDKVLNQLKNPEEFKNRIQDLNEHRQCESFDELYFIDGKVFETYSKPYQIRDDIVGRVWSFRDITMRKQMEHQLFYQANHDLLTGLPNRTLLYDRIKQSINYVTRYQSYLNMLFLDIDNFKLINDNLGHESGDILLKEVANRLQECIRDTDTVARFGGDEFVILFITNHADALPHLSQKVLERVSQPIKLLSHEIVVTTSIGVSIYPKDGNDAATLMKNADIAMYLAKKQGRNNFMLYDNSYNQSSKALQLQTELRNALENNQFFPMYQPIIELSTGKIVAAEILVRWLHPEKGLIMPQEFISIAEESGIIVPLGAWIFRTACFQNKQWQNMGLNPVRMAINISGIQLKRDNFISMVEECLQDSELDPRYLELELTESVIMSDSTKNLQYLKYCHQLGIHLTIDDFGTGYSSLNYLKQFPVSKLKIDRGFVQNCTKDISDASIIEAIIAMGHRLKLSILAEGIEKMSQLSFLEANGCDEGQGFLYSKPVSAEAFAELLAQEKMLIRKKKAS